jgi:hypothetical protein
MVVIGKFTLAEPSFRTASRIVAIKEEEGKITFALQFQHESEPNTWITEEWFPWHASNFNSIIRAGAKFHHLIERIIQLEAK